MRAFVWHFLLEPLQGISSLCISVPKMSIQKSSESIRWCPCIWCLLPKTIKPNVFWIRFCDQTAMTVAPLFVNLLITVCLYLSMWAWLKGVGSDKLLESTLLLIDFCVTSNVCKYVYSVIHVLLIITRIWKLMGYYNQGSLGMGWKKYVWVIRTVRMWMIRFNDK